MIGFEDGSGISWTVCKQSALRHLKARLVLVTMLLRVHVKLGSGLRPKAEVPILVFTEGAGVREGRGANVLQS